MAFSDMFESSVKQDGDQTMRSISIFEIAFESSVKQDGDQTRPGAVVEDFVV